MRKNGFWFKAIVKDDERAFLTRDGRFERLLAPGRHSAFDPGGHISAEVVKVVRGEIAADRAVVFERAHPRVAADNFEIVRAGPDEIAIVSLDGEPKHLVLPNTTRAFWTVLTEVAVERIDTAKELRVDPKHLAKLDLTRTTQVAHAAWLLPRKQLSGNAIRPVRRLRFTAISIADWLAATDSGVSRRASKIFLKIFNLLCPKGLRPSSLSR